MVLLYATFDFMCVAKYVYQGCKRDVALRDRDETEAFEVQDRDETKTFEVRVRDETRRFRFRAETRPRR